MKIRTLAVSSLLLAGICLAPARSEAFCGFYVAPSDAPLYADATMVALMRDGSRTALSMSNNYKGPPEDFAMVVPVPVVLQKENVKTLPLDLFKRIEALSAPRLVEYWEQDPCYEPPPDFGGDYDKAAPMAMASAQSEAKKDYGVKIEAQFSVGEYEVVVLSAEQSDGLEQWLVDNKYKIPKGASAALAPYIKEQQKFFVAKVDVKKVQRDAAGVVVLSPLRFHYETSDFRLPVRLGLLNAPPPGSGGAKQDLIVYVLSKDKRYEVANYKNVFIPTNLDVTDETRKAFGSFYAALFDATLTKAGGKAVVTEYSWMSSGCDPCPTPPLGDSDIATLGGDALLGMGVPSGGGPGVTGDSKSGYYGGSQPMVLTRLHTRYDASTLTDDLVFREASAVVGGREWVVGQDGALEKGANPDSYNNFQARYAIRHPWTGPIACAKPRRGVWGGPPGDVAPPSTVAATDLAAAPRSDLQLASYVVSNASEIDLKKEAPLAGVPPTSTGGPKDNSLFAGLLAVTAVVVIFGGSVLVMRRRA
jgi:hypothetical protein